MHRKGANCLIIPRTGWDRHTLYITLCYYRQCDQKPDEVMTAMLLYKRLAPYGTTFLQCLHYSAATTGYASGHYFINFGPYSGSTSKTDLAIGQALAWFAGLTKEQRIELCPLPKPDAPRWGSNTYTNVFLAEQAKKMKSVTIKGDMEILDPKHAPLYENPQLKEKQA